MLIVKQATGYRSLYISVCERQGAMRRGETHRPAAVAAMTAPREARARVRLRRRAASAASGGESAAVRVAGRRGTARERRARTGRLWCACCRTARALRLRRGGRRSGARGACGGSCREHHRARRELRWGQHGHAAAEQQNKRSGGGRGCHARHVTRARRAAARLSSGELWSRSGAAPSRTVRFNVVIRYCTRGMRRAVAHATARAAAQPHVEQYQWSSALALGSRLLRPRRRRGPRRCWPCRSASSASPCAPGRPRRG